MRREKKPAIDFEFIFTVVGFSGSVVCCCVGCFEVMLLGREGNVLRLGVFVMGQPLE